MDDAIQRFCSHQSNRRNPCAQGHLCASPERRLLSSWLIEDGWPSRRSPSRTGSDAVPSSEPCRQYRLFLWVSSPVCSRVPTIFIVRQSLALLLIETAYIESDPENIAWISALGIMSIRLSPNFRKASLILFAKPASDRCARLAALGHTRRPKPLSIEAESRPR